MTTPEPYDETIDYQAAEDAAKRARQDRYRAAKIAACRLSGVEGLSGRSLMFEAQAVEAYLRGEDR